MQVVKIAICIAPHPGSAKDPLQLQFSLSQCTLCMHVPFIFFALQIYNHVEFLAHIHITMDLKINNMNIQAHLDRKQCNAVKSTPFIVSEGKGLHSYSNH